MKLYYIQLFSPHGLIRHREPEIGRDTDTGGQVKYVLELLHALSEHEHVRKVDLFTRQIVDKRVSPAYAQPIETVNEKARIVRMKCGGSKYLRKERLWNHLEEFVDRTIQFNKDQNDIPDLVHGHYADGNHIARVLANFFQIPFFSTAHSLGRNKLAILTQGGASARSIDKDLNIKRRIREEEMAIAAADLVITSTSHEIETQYTEYGAAEKANFEVISPGLNADLFYPFYRLSMPSFQMSIEQEQALYRISAQIDRFLFDPEKPLILSIGRPDKRKNFETIIKAYGDDKTLQAMANLAIFAGVRQDIAKMAEDEQEILTNLLLLMDKYDLYGKLAIPKRNDPKLEIPEIYRLAARKKGVFINATPGENFGLTIIEAAACGLPVIASTLGGPKEILEKCNNGFLVDVDDTVAIAEAAKQIIGDHEKWERFSSQGIQGVHDFYSWSSHAESYLAALQEVDAKKQDLNQSERRTINVGRRLSSAEIFVICDLDGTLIEEGKENDLQEFKAWITAKREQIVFGLATGRNRHLTADALADHDLPEPDILITSAGSELYYTNDFIADSGWASHISYRWNRAKVERVLGDLPRLSLQEEDAQWEFKLSYYVDEEFSGDDLADLHKVLDDNQIKVNVLLTENTYLDILPLRASKGNALKYISYKWRADLKQFITAGNSGNDIDMLRGKTKGIVVANYSAELEPLRRGRQIYFSSQPLAQGVLEGLRHWIPESS